MIELTDFLLARIDEDEAAFRAERDGGDPGPEVLTNDRDLWTQLLAEVGTKQRIVELSATWISQSERAHGHDAADVMLKTQAITAETVLRTLASVYADHPDFDPAWAQP